MQEQRQERKVAWGEVWGRRGFRGAAGSWGAVARGRDHLEGRLGHLARGAVYGGRSQGQAGAGLPGFGVGGTCGGVQQLQGALGGLCVQSRRPGDTSWKGAEKQERAQKGIGGPFPV